jgi:hypothetical protein
MVEEDREVRRKLGYGWADDMAAEIIAEAKLRHKGAEKEGQDDDPQRWKRRAKRSCPDGEKGK